MKKTLVLLATLTMLSPAFAQPECESTPHSSSLNPVCTINKSAPPLLVQNAAAPKEGAKEELGRPLTRSELKREIAREKKRKEKERQALIRQKRCAVLEERMNKANEELKMASGAKRDAAERKAQRATKRYVTACPK